MSQTGSRPENRRQGSDSRSQTRVRRQDLGQGPGHRKDSRTDAWADTLGKTRGSESRSQISVHDTGQCWSRYRRQGLVDRSVIAYRAGQYSEAYSHVYFLYFSRLFSLFPTFIFSIFPGDGLQHEDGTTGAAADADAPPETEHAIAETSGKAEASRYK